MSKNCKKKKNLNQNDDVYMSTCSFDESGKLLILSTFFFLFSLHRKVRIIMNDFSLLNNAENSIQFFLTTVSTRVL